MGSSCKRVKNKPIGAILIREPLLSLYLLSYRTSENIFLKREARFYFYRDLISSLYCLSREMPFLQVNPTSKGSLLIQSKY